MSAAEDWARTRELRRQRESPSMRVKAKYRVKCRECGVMTDWHGDDVCPECARKMSAPTAMGNGQVHGNT